MSAAIHLESGILVQRRLSVGDDRFAGRRDAFVLVFSVSRFFSSVKNRKSCQILRFIISLLNSYQQKLLQSRQLNSRRRFFSSRY